MAPSMRIAPNAAPFVLGRSTLIEVKVPEPVAIVFHPEEIDCSEPPL